MAEKTKELHERISDLTDQDLLQMVYINSDQYRSEAVTIAKTEIARRGISPADLDRTQISTSSVHPLIRWLPKWRERIKAFLKSNPIVAEPVVRPVLKITAIAIVAFCEVVKYKTAGWLAVTIGLVIYPGIGFIHYYIHARSIRYLRVIGWSHLVLIGLSHIMLIFAFLFQYDLGDGPGWLTITVLTGEGRGYPSSEPPSWWTPPMLMNMVVFLPVFVTWGALLKKGSS